MKFDDVLIPTGILHDTEPDLELNIVKTEHAAQNPEATEESELKLQNPDSADEAAHPHLNRPPRRKRRAGIVIFTAVAVVGLILLLLLWLGGSDNSSDGYSGTGVNIEGMEIPAFSGRPYAVVNGNVPFFTDEEKSYSRGFESYSELDRLGRCGMAFACIDRSMMPTGKRGDIGFIKPTGWHQAKYPGLVDSNPPYLYNRCHLIAYCLTGEDANERNLITGTRYMNATGMLPFEEQVAAYLDRSRNHVLYRVTPVFEGNNLVADGVLMEAYSVEDHGKSIAFCVYCYNVQPGVVIDYRTGENH